MNYYMVRWECDAGCGEVEDTEEHLPFAWVTVDGEDYCPNCAPTEVEDEASGD